MDINLYTIGNDLEFRDSGLIADSDIEEKMHYESSPDIMDMVVQDTFNDSNKNRFNPAAIPSNTDYHLASSNVIGLGSDDSLPNTAIIQQKQQKDSVSHIDYNHSTIFNPKITQIQINSNVRTGQTNLVHTSELGKWASLFNFQSFNQMQSSLFNLIVYTSRNLLVSAPTGSGKTVVFELAIIQALESQQKAVYIAPTRALCQEKFNDWKHRFSKSNISVCLLTGDSLPNNYMANLKTARIIVTTPEKWDSFTRSADNQIMQSVKLCCVDEIHGVRDKTRGATLEVVVTRCKYQQCRLVCASATIPNINDFAIWLQAEAKIFGDEYRSVPIKKHVLGYKNTYNQFQLDEILKFNLVDVIKRYGDGKPTLVFCKTRKDVISTCQELAKTPSLFVNSSNRKTLEQVVFKDKKLLEFVKNGVGFHHAGLDYADRQSVEALFMTSKLKVICCTSTLAVGVNLPARMVIIKGTSQYDFSTGKMKQYCDHDINQMVGRAGRPQFDADGIAVIMTSEHCRKHFEQLVAGKSIIESQLHTSLVEHLNAEISMRTVDSHSQAISWLKSTFLFVRIKIEPSYYKFKSCSKENAVLEAENRLEAIFESCLDNLKQYSIVKYNGDKLTPSAYSMIMAKYYLKFETVCKFITVKPNITEPEFFDLFCSAAEFGEVRYRQDKVVLNSLACNNAIKFGVKKRVSERYEKVSVLIQVALGSVTVPESSRQAILSDTNMVMKNAERVARGMVPILLENNYYLPLIYGFRVANCIAAGIWNDSKYILTQVEGLGLRYAQMLHEKDIKTFGRLMECTPGQIELATGRNQPFGIKILKSVESIPLCNMNITHLKSAPNQHEYKVELRLKKPSALVKKTHAFHLLIGSSSGSMIKSTKICAFKLTSPVTYSIKFKPTIANETIQFNLISYDFVGIDVKYEIHLCNSIKNMPKSSSGGSKYFEDSLWDGIDDQTLLKMCEQQEAIQMSQGPNEMKPKPSDCNPGPITMVGKRRLAKSQLKLPGKLKSVPEIAKIVSQFPVLDQESNCMHICKDKSKCLHLCCKIGVKGIKRSRSKSKKPSEDNSTDETELAKKTTKNDIIRKNVEEHLMKEECDEIGYDDDDTLFIQYKETMMGESAELDQPLASIEKQPNDSEEFRAVSISPEKSIFGCDDEFVEYWDEIPENTIDKDDSAGKSTKQSIPTKSLSFISSGFGSCESHQSQHSTISKCALPSTVVKMDRSQSSISDFSSESNTQPNEMVQEAAKLDAKEIEAFKSILQDLV